MPVAAAGQNRLPANLAAGGNSVRQIIRAIFFLAIGGFDRRQVQPLPKHGRTPGLRRRSDNGGGMAEGKTTVKDLGPAPADGQKTLQAELAVGGSRARQIIPIQSGRVDG